MAKIIVLIGKSGSGKTTLANLLAAKYDYDVIQSFTTRPKRSENETGHIFVNRDDYTITMSNRDTMSLQVYNKQYHIAEEVVASTIFDGHYYWTTLEQFSGDKPVIYCVDPIGYIELKERIISDDMVAIYLNISPSVQISRMTKRGDSYITAHRRSLHDSVAFSVVPCNYVVDAEPHVEHVFEVVSNIITGGNETHVR